MKIGLQVPNFTYPGGPAQLATKLAEIARAAEDAGFYSLWVMDHFFQISMIGPHANDMLESYCTLGYLEAYYIPEAATSMTTRLSLMARTCSKR